MKKLLAILLITVMLMGTLGVAGVAFFAAPLPAGNRPTPPVPTASSSQLNATAPSFERQNSQQDVTVHIGGREFNATRTEQYTVRERDSSGNLRDVQRTRTVWVNRNIRYNGHNAHSRHNIGGRFVSLTTSVGRVDGAPRMASTIEFWGDGRLLERVDVPLDGTRGISIGLQGVRILEIRVTRPSNATQQPTVALINPTVNTAATVSASAQREYEQRVANWERQVQRRAAWQELSFGERAWQQVLSGTATLSAIGAITLFVYGAATDSIGHILWALALGAVWMVSGFFRVMGRG